MASVSLPYGSRNVRLAERLAAANDGAVLEQHPAGYVTVEASPCLRVSRALVEEAFGKAVSDFTWRSLAVRRNGLVAMLTDAEILIQDDLLETGYLVPLPADLAYEAEAWARERGSTLQDLVIGAVRRELALAQTMRRAS